MAVIMQMQSRRRFIQSCLAAAGSVCAGCRDEDSPAPGADAVGDQRQGQLAGGGGAKTGAAWEPAYLKLHRTGELKKRGRDLWKRMKPCKLCPRVCGVDRLGGKKGFCNATSDLVIASYHPHYGEEKPLVGKGG